MDFVAPLSIPPSLSFRRPLTLPSHPDCSTSSSHRSPYLLYPIYSAVPFIALPSHPIPVTPHSIPHRTPPHRSENLQHHPQPTTKTPTPTPALTLPSHTVYSQPPPTGKPLHSQISPTRNTFQTSPLSPSPLPTRVASKYILNPLHPYIKK